MIQLISDYFMNIIGIDFDLRVLSSHSNVLLKCGLFRSTHHTILSFGTPVPRPFISDCALQGA